MPGISSISLLDQVAENAIVNGRYCKRFYMKDVWIEDGADVEKNATTGLPKLHREPVTNTIMLTPSYDATVDTADADCTQTGGTWKEVLLPWGSGTYLEQTDSSAGETDCKPTTAYPAGQAFWIDLFLRSSTAADYLVTITWGAIWRLKIRRDGSAVMECKATPEGEETDYKPVATGSLTENGADVFGKRHTLSFWPMKRRTMLVKTGVWGSSMGLQTALVADMGEDAGYSEGYEPWTITHEDSPKVTVSDGGYIIGFRKMTYEADGYWMSPVTVINEYAEGAGGPGFTDAPTLSADYVLWGGSVTHSVRDKDGVAFGGGADKTVYRDRLDLESDGTHTLSPQVFWTQVEIPENVAENGALESEIGDYVQRITEKLALEDGSHNVTVEFRPLEIDDPGGLGSWDLKDCINAYWKLQLNGAARTAGYTADPEWRVFEGFGQLVWPECQNRLLKAKHTMISDATAYDGMVHTEAVASLLSLCGWVVTEDFLYAIDETGLRLPNATEDEEPLFRFSNGTTVFDAIRYICEKFSGWNLVVDSDGTINYQPMYDETIQATFSTTSEGVAENRRMRDWQTRADSSQFYNQIWVVGEAPNGDILVEYWQAPVSWTISTGYGGSPGYPDATVGEQRKLIYIDPALNTQAACEQSMLVLKERHGKPKLLASMTSGYDGALRPGMWVEADNPPESGIAGLSMSKWKILSINTEVDQDDAKASYELEWQGVWTGLA